MKVILRQPRREVEIHGPRHVGQLLTRMELPVESVLVIRGDDLLTIDDQLTDDDVIELRPVISGG